MRPEFRESILDTRGSIRGITKSRFIYRRNFLRRFNVRRNFARGPGPPGPIQRGSKSLEIFVCFLGPTAPYNEIRGLPEARPRARRAPAAPAAPEAGASPCLRPARVCARPGAPGPGARPASARCGAARSPRRAVSAPGPCLRPARSARLPEPGPRSAPGEAPGAEPPGRARGIPPASRLPGGRAPRERRWNAV